MSSTVYGIVHQVLLLLLYVSGGIFGLAVCYTLLHVCLLVIKRYSEGVFARNNAEKQITPSLFEVPPRLRATKKYIMFSWIVLLCSAVLLVVLDLAFKG